jgi:CRISPR-associated protein Cas8b1/Cst1 subtype I-B
MRKEISTSTAQTLCAPNCETQKMCNLYLGRIRLEKENNKFFLNIPEEIFSIIKKNKNLNLTEKKIYT